MKNLSNYEWFCDYCDECLDDQAGFDVNCGEWTCTNCGGINPINESEIINDFDTTFDNDEIPEWCSACGGPYPHCKISCNIFDD